MPAFMKIQGVEGESSDQGHKGWILIQSLSAPISRSIQEGARDQQRSRGETTLGDVIVVRELDKSSVPLQQACAKGDRYPSIEIHLCTNVKGKAEPYLKYVLKDVIITSYSFHGTASGDPVPTEEVTFNYTSVDWTYVTLDPQKGTPSGQVPGSYNPGKGAA